MYGGYAPLDGTYYEEPTIDAFDEFINFGASDKSASRASSEEVSDEESPSTLFAATQATTMEVDGQDAHVFVNPAALDSSFGPSLYSHDFNHNATVPTITKDINSSAFQYNGNPAADFTYGNHNDANSNYVMPAPYPALPQLPLPQFQPPSASANSTYGSPGYNMLLQQPFDPAQHLAQRLQTYVGGFNQMNSAPAYNGHQGGLGPAYNGQQIGNISSAAVNGMGGAANNQAVFPHQAPQASINGASDNTAAPAPAQHHIPAFTTDLTLNSEQACREYLAHADINDLKSITIPNDDYAIVQQFREQEFTARLYNALAHAYSQAAPSSDSLLVPYLSQQETAMTDVAKILQTPTGSKRAKAQCYLLVRAVIHLSTHGFNKKAHDGKTADNTKGHAIMRDHHVDTDLICSARLTKLEEIIQSNKLIAKDVISGTNFSRMCQDPAYYLEEKGKLLASNAARAERTQKLNGGAKKGRKTRA